jgi:uncharacterized protein (DUF433 family)
MATLTDDRVAVPSGLVHLVLGVIASADVWHGEPSTDTFDRLVAAIRSEDATLLPAALGECLMPLRGDAERCNLALDMIRQFDLFEAAPGLAALLRDAPTRRAVLTAACLAPHPATTPLLGNLAQLGAASLDDARLSARVNFLLEGEPPEGMSETDRLLYAERWPGRVGLGQTLLPLAVIATNAGPPAEVLRLALDFRRAGAQLRRLPFNTGKVPPGWLASDSGVAIIESELPQWWPRYSRDRSPRVIRSGGYLSELGRRDLVSRASRSFKGRLSFRPFKVGRLTGDGSAEPLLDIGVFFQGALSLPEVHLLTGWSTATIRKRGSDFLELRPKSPGFMRGSYLDFGQLTALRIEHYVLTRFGRQPSQELAARIVREARQNESVPLAITSTGDVLFEEDAEIYTDAHGQASMSAARVSEIAEEFKVEGAPVPGLRRPSAHTSVHPGVSLGSPVVEGTRVTARAVRDVLARGRAGGFVGTESYNWARRYFAELSDEQIDDASRLGERILG